MHTEMRRDRLEVMSHACARTPLITCGDQLVRNTEHVRLVVEVLLRFPRPLWERSVATGLGDNTAVQSEPERPHVIILVVFYFIQEAEQRAVQLDSLRLEFAKRAAVSCYLPVSMETSSLPDQLGAEFPFLCKLCS